MKQSKEVKQKWEGLTNFDMILKVLSQEGKVGTRLCLKPILKF